MSGCAGCAVAAFQAGSLGYSLNAQGWLLVYVLGVLKVLGDLGVVGPDAQIAASGSASLLAAAVCSKAPYDDIVGSLQSYWAVSQQHALRSLSTRRLLLRQAADTMLPANAHTLCTSKALVTTRTGGPAAAAAAAAEQHAAAAGGALAAAERVSSRSGAVHIATPGGAASGVAAAKAAGVVDAFPDRAALLDAIVNSAFPQEPPHAAAASSAAGAFSSAVPLGSLANFTGPAAGIHLAHVLGAASGLPPACAAGVRYCVRVSAVPPLRRGDGAAARPSLPPPQVEIPVASNSSSSSSSSSSRGGGAGGASEISKASTPGQQHLALVASTVPVVSTGLAYLAAATTAGAGAALDAIGKLVGASIGHTMPSFGLSLSLGNSSSGGSTGTTTTTSSSSSSSSSSSRSSGTAGAAGAAKSAELVLRVTIPQAVPAAAQAAAARPAGAGAVAGASPAAPSNGSAAAATAWQAAAHEAFTAAAGVAEAALDSAGAAAVTAAASAAAPPFSGAGADIWPGLSQAMAVGRPQWLSYMVLPPTSKVLSYMHLLGRVDGYHWANSTGLVRAAAAQQDAALAELLVRRITSVDEVDELFKGLVSWPGGKPKGFAD